MEWFKVFASESDAKHHMAQKTLQLIILNGERICLAYTQQQFFAVQDKCTHNGDSLSKGHLNHLGEVICPWHNYCFNLQSGSEAQDRSRDLKTYPIKVDESGFYIGI
jgi:3-phenylpropionate/trans-cinnamate dioxygenase ferredoxin subunit